jgi:ABC-type dipeptide/oligopeptide/nickel transport system permease subunit
MSCSQTFGFSLNARCPVGSSTSRAPYLAIFPGLLIFLTVLSINYIGDGLRDALDHRRTGG